MARLSDLEKYYLYDEDYNFVNEGSLREMVKFAHTTISEVSEKLNTRKLLTKSRLRIKTVVIKVERKYDGETIGSYIEKQKQLRSQTF